MIKGQLLDDAEREGLRQMHALAVDSDGNEHLVGLTVDQTEFLFWFAREPVGGDFPSKQDIDRYLAMVRAHERSRLAAVDAKVRSQIDRRGTV